MTDIFTTSTTNEAAWLPTSGSPAEGGPISFDRCVDWLLDLHQSTTSPELRLLVTDVLSELRALGPVEGEFEDVVVGALASVETAFEIATR